MKTNFTAKLFGLTLVTALTLTALTACGNGGAATTASGTASGSALQSGDGGSVGTVLLSVNPEIEMDYDEVGNVVALTGLNGQCGGPHRPQRGRKSGPGLLHRL